MTATPLPVPTATLVPLTASPTTMLSPAPLPEGWSIKDVISISDLSGITKYADYQYLTPEYDDPATGNPAGKFWSVYSAMLEMEFRAHRSGGMEKLEDYRTAAMPGSVIWLDSDRWDSACIYQLDEWTAEIVAVRGDTCYFIAFVPSAYPEFDKVTLGTALMEMFINNLEKSIQ